MKKTVTIMALLLLLASCAIPPGPSVCEKPEAATSFICKACLENNTTPEALNGILLDANAIALITNRYQRQDALRVITVLQESMDATQSYNHLISLLFKESGDAQLVAAIISRHISMFQSPLIISNFDKGLIRYHLDQQRMMLE